jgi:hypothetical protein
MPTGSYQKSVQLFAQPQATTRRPLLAKSIAGKQP